MGLISRRQEQANRELAAPVTVMTSLAIAETVELINSICREFNEVYDARAATASGLRRTLMTPSLNHYHVLIEDKVVLVSYAIPPGQIAHYIKRGSTLGRFWVAQVRFPKATRADTPAGMRAVELSLLRWTTVGSSKTMGNRERYTAFGDRLFDALRPHG